MNPSSPNKHNNSSFNKVFGIGMSKTGTTTLEYCFKKLGLLPHAGFHLKFTNNLLKKNQLNKIIRYANKYKSFQNDPWYHLYKELDMAFPDSKFILTVRKDSIKHALSSWNHGVKNGERNGEPDKQYINDKTSIYENHNLAVQKYFQERTDDLLIICWDNGDGWEKLCNFLELPVPDEDLPHLNKAGDNILVRIRNYLKRTFIPN
jgi:hypothetical protein